MTHDLTGKHAIVTGGGTGIGLAIAQALADAGANVTITGRRLQPLQDAAAAHERLFPMAMDVTDENSVQDVFEKAVTARGPISICVANAGMAEARKLHEMDMDTWRRTMNVNLDGAFLTIRAALQSMRTLEWGRVIGVSSIAGLKGLKGMPAYTTSKHGLVGLIRGLAADYVGTGITCNALCPAYVDTPLVEHHTNQIAKHTGYDEAKSLAFMVNQNPHKRLIRPEEVSAAAMWLCGPGSESINGQTIEISGGQI